MSPQPGQMLSHYRLIEKIGEGGMGVVWRAEDTVLNRTVAIKVLTDDVVQDEERRRMFLEEARLASSVSDAHIVQIHEFRREEGLDFIVMEYVEGKPLKNLMHGRPLPPHKVVDFGHQVARALSRAHRKNLLHRDLKPGNVLVTEDGEVKVVDFGLAMLFRDRDRSIFSPTATTRTGIEDEAKPAEPQRIAGTLPYMSPEQARGERLDARSDIFSMGTVLYEMTTGHLPFSGPTSVELLESLARAKPLPVHELEPGVPLELARIIHKSLSARPADRYQSTEDLAVDLKHLERELESGSAPSYRSLTSPVAKRQRRGLWGLAGALIVAAIAIAAWQIASRTTPDDGAGDSGDAARTVDPVHTQLTFSGSADHPAISPDGQFLAYSEASEEGGQAVMLQDLSGGPSLEIFRVDWVFDLRWSPDGSRLAISAWKDEGNGCWLLPRLGGPPRRIGHFCETWSPDGNQLAAGPITWKKIELSEVSTGKTSSIPLPDSFVWLRDVDWSFHGNRLLFLTEDESGDRTVWTIDAGGHGEPVKAVKEKELQAPRWAASGDAIYYLIPQVRSRDLWKVYVDPRSGVPRKEPSRVLSSMRAASSRTSISLSGNGKKMAYVSRTSYSNLWLVSLADTQSGGRPEATQLTSGTYTDENPSISPDGRFVAFSRDTRDTANIFTISSNGGSPQQITFRDSTCRNPVWSPDGEEIAFVSRSAEASGLWRVNSRGGTPRPVGQSQASPDGHLAWAPGAAILYLKPGNRNFYILDPETETEIPLLSDESTGWIFHPKYSPDGTRVAVFWNRVKDDSPAPGYWIVSIGESPEAPRLVRSFQPGSHESLVGWSPDGAWVYLARDDEQGIAISRVSAEGGPLEPVFRLPLQNVDEGALSSDATKFVYTVTESKQDIWLVENFDPDVN